jgi:hypothetical protein
MDFRRRRDFRGAFRATPEEILRDAIAQHKALRDREQLRTKPAAPAPVKKPRRTVEETRRAQFAEGMARAAFGRFYPKERPK